MYRLKKVTLPNAIYMPSQKQLCGTEHSKRNPSQAMQVLVIKIYPIRCLDPLTEGVGQDPVLDTAHQLVSLLGQTQSQDLEAGLVYE